MKLKDIEDWLLLGFLPWFKSVSTAVGMLTVVVGLGFIASPFLGMHPFAIAIGIIFGSGAFYLSATKHYWERRIPELVEEKKYLFENLDMEVAVDRARLEGIIEEIGYCLMEESYPGYAFDAVAKIVSKKIALYREKKKDHE